MDTKHAPGNLLMRQASAGLVILQGIVNRSQLGL